MAVLAPPVVVVAAGAPPFVAVSGNAPPFVAVSGNAPPITLVAAGAPPITLYNEDGSIWTGGAGTTPVGGAAILVGETNGFAVDFIHPVDAERVAVKTAGVVVASGLDAFFTNAGTSPKMVYDVSGTLVWSPHNAIFSSEDLRASFTFSGGSAPTATFFLPTAVSAIHRIQCNSTNAPVGETWTYSAVVSAGGYSKIGIIDSQTPTTDVAFDLSNGTKLYQAASANGTITALGGGQYLVTNTYTLNPGATRPYLHVLPDSYTTGVVTGVWTADGVKGINVFRQQDNRGTVPTAYLSTTSVSSRAGLAIDYHPSTHTALGLLVEPAATNLLLNSVALSTQSVTVTAVAHTLSFLGTGTITLTGVSTAGPLVGTGASNLVSLTFTPTAGSLTLTVTGTVSNAQLEVGTFASSRIPTFGVTQTRVADNYSFLLSQIPALGSLYSFYVRFSAGLAASGRYPYVLTDGTANENVGLVVAPTVQLSVRDNNVAVGSATSGTAVADVMMSVAARIKIDDCAISTAGAAVVLDNTVPGLPTMTQVSFGSGSGGGATTNTSFRIPKMAIVTSRGWSNAELQTRSAT